MEILEKQTWWIFRCENCRSKNSAEPSDVQYGSACDSHSEYYVECAHCGQRRVVPRTKLTERMTEAAIKAYQRKYPND